MFGSSPHTRGTHKRATGKRRVQRFIPAYAGNAPARPFRCPRCPVHPRIRGERVPCDIRPAAAIGSSPHTRGTLSTRGAVRVRQRFIPAYAGNAIMARKSLDTNPVHPRIRGERITPIKLYASSGGSSPHTRGTRTLWPPKAKAVAVHPRIRGERSDGVIRHRFERGSSPHTRGTHCLEWGLQRGVRFIPAYAGNARSPIRADGFAAGSSPHTRGTRETSAGRQGRRRFIPAYAGNAGQSR